jgi:hypothetical protein
MVFSPKHQLKGQCVLMTGGLSFEGSVVLEQLLRLTEVSSAGGVACRQHWQLPVLDSTPKTRFTGFKVFILMLMFNSATQAPGYSLVVPKQHHSSKATSPQLSQLLTLLVSPGTQLLQVKAVYLLVRAKKNIPAATRVQDLLCSPLFNHLHQDILAGRRNPFSRVHTVEGDLTRPGLGLSHQDLRTLRSNVNFVLHCGALMELEADVQKALR